MNPIFEKQLSDSRELNQIIKQCVATKNYTKLDGYLEKLKAADPYLDPSNNTQSGMKYYMPFHFAAFDKVKNSYIAALENNTLPTISIKFEEIDHYRKKLKFESYGSPQDVLYGFTSERYKNWGESLTKLFFQSASMTGVGEMLVTTAPRYLKFEKTDIEIDEIEGAIPFDFWETQDVLHKSFALQLIEDLKEYVTKEDGNLFPAKYDKEAVSRVQSFLRRLKKKKKFGDKILQTRMDCILGNIERYLDKKDSYNISPFKKVSENNQEQIAMKFADEGRYIQKILDGQKVEHVQSNVKMVVNPVRGNKCEVDSIYRVLGKNEVVLLEAKGGNSVSVGQLYQIYETFRLKLPSEWKVKVLALLLSSKNDMAIRTVIDIIEVEFNNKHFGDIAESMHSVLVKKHYKWNIKKSS